MLTTSLAFRTLKPTLDKILSDDTDGTEKVLNHKKYMKVENMDDAYIDELFGGERYRELVGA